MKKYRKYLALFLSCFTLIFSSFGSFASGGANHGYEWTATDKAAYIVSHIGDIIGYGYQWIASDGAWQDVKTSIFDLAAIKAAEAQMSSEEWLLSNTSFAYKFDGDVVENADTVDSITFSQEFGDLIQTTINTYVAENPLGYVGCYISSYNFLDSSSFNFGISSFNNIKTFMKNHDLTFVCTPNGHTRANDGIWLVGVERSKYDVNFIGTTLGGSFSNVYLEHDWQNMSNVNFPENTDGIEFAYLTLGSTNIGIGDNWSDAFSRFNNSSAGSWKPNMGGLHNISGFSGTGQQKSVFSHLEKNELVYVFDTLNAYKSYNSGSPQPYYLGSGFGSHVNTYNVNDFSSMSSYYNSVVDNSKTGMTPDEVQKLIDEILDRLGNGNGNGNGNGSGSGSSGSNFWEWLISVGDSLGNFIGALGEAINRIISGIVNAVMDVVRLLVGDDENAGLLDRMNILISTGFNDFLTGVFEWLPIEVVTAFTSVLVIGIFFSIWKMIRG